MRTPRVPCDSISEHESEISLAPSASHYLVRVLRLDAGVAFTLFDPARTLEATATLVSRDLDASGRARARVGAAHAITRRQREITVIYALAKGDKVDAVVRDATELGATRFVAVETSRSVVRLDDARGKARLARWTTIAREAARQSGRADAPEVRGPIAWSAAIADAKHGTRLLLHPRGAIVAKDALADALAEDTRAVTLAIGPEGGFSDEEIAHAESAGFAIARIGGVVLRTETVVAAVLGAIAIADA